VKASGEDAEKKTVAVIGDSTFMHSGMTGLANIAYNRSNTTVMILDNSITGMTGHQDNPGSGKTLQGEIAEKLRIEKILAAMGYENIIIVDPQDLKAMDAAIENAAHSEVPAAIVVRRPCLLIKGIKHDIGKCAVNQDLCIGCKSCLKVGCPAILVENRKARIDQNQCVGCTVCAQVCPKKAIFRKEDV
jgi:indolepyruvate ferredoxin oxidoreductase alpha subunit